MKRLLFVVLILGASTCWAVSGCDGAGNCYVRAAATGSGSGIDWTDAYTSLPGSLTRGVTYYVAAGNYSSHNFNDADSGTTLITVHAATIASHGTATGWSDAYQGQAVFTAPITFGQDYYIFSGVYRSAVTGNPMTDWVLESGYGFKVNNQGVGARSGFNGGSGYSGATCGNLAACSAAGMFVHDITVQYVDINGSHVTTDGACCDTGFDFEGGSYNLTFSYNYTHDDWVPYFIKGNHAHQAGGGYFFGTGDGISLKYTYIQHNYSSPTYHSELCSCSEGLTNFTLAYNVFDQSGGVGGNGATAHIGTASGGGYNTGNGPNGPWNIYGNIFTCSATSSTMNCAVGDGVLAIWDATFTGTVYFLNNTVYDIGPHSLEGAFGFGLGFTTPMTTMYVQNNLFYNNDSMSVIANGTTSYNGATFSSGVTWGYNAYFSTPTASGSDGDSHKQVSASNPFNNSGACCLLASDTVAGISTSGTLAANNTDMLGVARGANGTWDRGALQISSSRSQPPAAPTGLTAAVN